MDPVTSSRLLLLRNAKIRCFLGEPKRPLRLGYLRLAEAQSLSLWRSALAVFEEFDLAEALFRLSKCLVGSSEILALAREDLIAALHLFNRGRLSPGGLTMRRRKNPVR